MLMKCINRFATLAVNLSDIFVVHNTHSVPTAGVTGIIKDLYEAGRKCFFFFLSDTEKEEQVDRGRLLYKQYTSEFLLRKRFATQVFLHNCISCYFRFLFIKLSISCQAQD